MGSEDVIIVHKEKPTVATVGRDALFDKRLSLRARGMYAILCALINGKEGVNDNLRRYVLSGKDTRRALAELDELGYAQVKEGDIGVLSEGHP